MNINIATNQLNKFDLKFSSHTQEKLFLEMFNVLLESRISTITVKSRGRRIYRPIRSSSKIFRVRIKRQVSQFDIEICLAALCMLNWPGKSNEYKQQIEEIKNLYYNNVLTRKLILNSLKNNLNNNFRNIQTKSEIYFLNLNDLII